MNNNKNRGRDAYNNAELLNLVRRAKNGDELATNTIINNFEKLIAKFANAYKTNNSNALRMEHEDIQQEGRIAVLRAIETFDEKVSQNFIACVIYHVKIHIWAITNETGYIVRFPEAVALDKNKVLKYEREYQISNGCLPKIQEIAANTGLTVKKIEEIKSKSNVMTFSLNGDDKENRDSSDEVMSYYNILPDTSLKSPEEVAIERDVCNIVNEKMKVLSDIERTVITELYGFNNKEIKTLQSIGEEIGITKQRVGQIKKSAVAKLAIELNEYRHAV
ncbi:MAG: sigma-70 family RNA polymerase sigma factor [Bacillota bacterium]|nr:sigma-70 family RNA polymerase sigma factor [Bacillota bacterium]